MGSRRVVHSSGFTLPGELSTVGLALPEELTFDQWRDVGRKLRVAQGAVMWWLGDWLCIGERKQWGKRYAEAVDELGFDYGVARDAKWLATKFQLSRRRDKISWSHHREVASLDDNTADQFLDEAEAEGWTRAQLRAEVHRRKTAARFAAPGGEGYCTVEDLNELVRAGRRFGTIYADPPWKYDNQATRASTGNHYEGMTIEELCALPIRALAADDAHLHLWTTNGFLFEGPRIFEAWGFEFRSSFIWAKPQIGIGNYWRNAHEIVLTAVRGDAKSFADHNLRSWIECDRAEHSDKPDQVRSFIERASPTPRIELFARNMHADWVSWGNQIKQNLFSAAAQRESAE